MREAGLAVFEDQAGNLIGRLDCGDPRAGTLACGSHLDSVRDAGNFDGPMGVVAGILAAGRIVAAGARLPHHLEIVAFSDEEGVRFQTTYLGSRALAGTQISFVHSSQSSLTRTGSFVPGASPAGTRSVTGCAYSCS